MKKYAMCLGACLALLSFNAAAHGDAKPMYGGVVQVAADIQYELVPQPNGAAIYVLDHGKPADASAMSGKLTVLNGTDKSEAPLKAAGGNKLEATGVKLGPGAKAVATIKLGDAKTKTVRFSLKQAAR